MTLGDRMAAAASGEGDWRPPDGWQGRVKVRTATAFTSRAGADLAKCELQIIGGDLAGRTFTHMMSLSAAALPITTEALLVYGVGDLQTITGIEELDNRMMALERNNTEYEVTVRHSGAFVNVNVHRAITGESDVTPPPAEDGLDARGQLAGQKSFDELVGEADDAT
jgi:hypothetical protein